jgi:hypothetical protein
MATRSAKTIIIPIVAVWTIFIAGRESAKARSIPGPEIVPYGVRFLARADSRRQLIDRVRADLNWTEADGTTTFLWARHTPNTDHWSFTLEQGYYLKQNGECFWGIIDRSCGDGRPFPDPIVQFLLFKFVRDSAEYPTTDVPDCNHTNAELLSKSPDRKVVFKISYVSIGGYRAQQEEVRTYLISIDPDGKCVLASRDLGHEGSNPHGINCMNDGFEFQVQWQSSAASPFTVKVRQYQYQFTCSEDGPDFDYTAYEDGTLDGALPMVPKIRDQQYTLGDGKLTLKSLAQTLIYFNADWIDSDWVKPEKQDELKSRVQNAWISELKRLNPGINPDGPIPVGRQILIPDENSYDDEIYDQLRAWAGS